MSLHNHDWLPSFFLLLFYEHLFEEIWILVCMLIDSVVPGWCS
jgi:hypothetical protein